MSNTDSDSELLATCLAKTNTSTPAACLLLPLSTLHHVAGSTTTAHHAQSLLAHRTYAWRTRHNLANSDGLTDAWIRLPDRNLTSCLNPGIRLGTVTEIVGESSSGKTQLCLQLSVIAQLPEHLGGQDGHVVYISTEGAFPTQRLNTMAEAYMQQYEDQQVVDRLGECLHNISVAEFEDYETMAHALRYKVPAILSRGNVRLVVIDSIAAHLRFDTDSNAETRSSTDFYKQRSEFLIELGQMFKTWTTQYSCAIVCVNQVKDIFDSNVHPRLPTDSSNMSVVPETAQELCLKDFESIGSTRKAPALGNLWANIVDVRIMLYCRRGLSVDEVKVGEEQGGEPVEVVRDWMRTRRWLELSFAPWCARRRCEVAIDDRGLYSLGINSHGIDLVGGIF